MMSRRTPPNRQGELQGLVGSINAIGARLAPALYNPALAWFSRPQAPIHFPGIVFALATAAGGMVLVSLTVGASPSDAGIRDPR